jgi:hypothetical protein
MSSGEDCASELQTGLAIIPGVQSSPEQGPEGKEDRQDSCHPEMKASSNPTTTWLKCVSRFRGARTGASLEELTAGASGTVASGS